MVTRLLIARHGNTFDAGDTVTRVGVTDLPLSQSGREQGRLLGRYLKQENLRPDIGFTSQLQRTFTTAELALQEAGWDVPLQKLSIFNEIDYGSDENKPEAEVVARLGEAAIKAWDENAIVPPGWKVDPQALTQNWKNFAADILREHAGKTILVVTSNGIARFAPILTGDVAAFRAQHKLKISTGALCLFEYEDGSDWRCITWNAKPKDLLKDKAVV